MLRMGKYRLGLLVLLQLVVSIQGWLNGVQHGGGHPFRAAAWKQFPHTNGRIEALNAYDTQTATEEPTTQEDQRNVALQQLIAMAQKYGPVGSYRSTEEQEELLTIARDFSTRFNADPAPARIELTGVHDLIYSAAPGGSSGRLFGPVYGEVAQEFVDDKTFINSVQLGPIRICLTAEREIQSDAVIKVIFLKTAVQVFGSTVLEKEITGGGIWKCLFAGTFKTEDNDPKLIRIMETPSLFILEQSVES